MIPAPNSSQPFGKAAMPPVLERNLHGAIQVIEKHLIPYRSANEWLSMIALSSLSRAILHQSRFEVPTVDQTPSTVAVLACSISPCHS